MPWLVSWIYKLFYSRTSVELIDATAFHRLVCYNDWSLQTDTAMLVDAVVAITCYHGSRRNHTLLMIVVCVSGDGVIIL